MRSGDVSSNLPLSSSQLLVYLPQASDIFSDFFGYHGSAANLGYACKKLGSRPTGFGGDRPRTNSSKPKTQIYI
jgi:hypothetical protein